MPKARITQTVTSNRSVTKLSRVQSEESQIPPITQLKSHSARPGDT